MPVRHQLQANEGASVQYRRWILPAKALQTYEIYVDDDRYAVPTLHFAEAADEQSAIEIARRLMEESPHHRGAELCLKGERLIGLGVFATRRTMAGRNAG